MAKKNFKTSGGKRVFPPEWYAAQAARRKKSSDKSKKVASSKRSEVNKSVRNDFKREYEYNKAYYDRHPVTLTRKNLRIALAEAKANKEVARLKTELKSSKDIGSKLKKEGFTARKNGSNMHYRRGDGVNVVVSSTGKIKVSRKTGVQPTKFY